MTNSTATYYPGKVAFVGTGLMGQPMVARLLNQGQAVIAYNRTSSKTDILRAAGADVAASVSDAVTACDCVILMLSDAAAIKSTVLTESCRRVLAGRTFIQMGTIAPAESQMIAELIAEENGQYFEAPVLGSIPEARIGRLIVMVGSTPEQFRQWSQLLRVFGPDPVLIGPVGQAAAVKLALNHLIGALTTSFALSLGFIRSHSVNVGTFMNILRGSALYAQTFDKKLERILERNYANPNFPTKHLKKDLELFIKDAQAHDLDTHTVVAIRDVVARAVEIGLSDSDYCSVYSIIDQSEDS